ncbi:hypothetical protein AAUPMC_04724 [Pasteurella multocida subsp. multocida str. Anand1_cattle]|nr:hypothetical protein AAUPMC_04724 [Pasteurella multocida subsp. multocida str. Anand1_cattle]
MVSIFTNSTTTLGKIIETRCGDTTDLFATSLLYGTTIAVRGGAALFG